MARHQLKEKDEITTSLRRFTDFVYGRQKEIVTGAAVLVVLAIAFIGWNIYASSRNASAQTQLSAAIAVYSDTTNIKNDKERYEKTIGESQKTIELYKQLYESGGYSKAAAAYELAVLYEANNQLDQAKDYYQKLATEFPDSPFRQEVDEAMKRLGVTLPPPTAQKPS